MFSDGINVFASLTCIKKKRETLMMVDAIINKFSKSKKQKTREQYRACHIFRRAKPLIHLPKTTVGLLIWSADRGRQVTTNGTT